VDALEEAQAWRDAHCDTLIPALQRLFAENGDIVRTVQEEEEEEEKAQRQRL
jgi:hypothetical protein